MQVKLQFVSVLDGVGQRLVDADDFGKDDLVGASPADLDLVLPTVLAAAKEETADTLRRDL